jgi:hypothetical protein
MSVRAPSWLTKRLRRVLLFTLALAALAKGGAYLPGYSIDDYRLILVEPAIGSSLGQGRFGEALTLSVFHHVGIEPEYSQVLFVTLAIASSALLGSLIARFWGVGAAGWLAVAVAAMTAIHPYTVEIVTFRAAIGTAVLTTTLAATLLIPRRPSRRSVIVGSLLFAAGVSIYQAIVNTVGMIVVMGLALTLLRGLAGGRGWRRTLASASAKRCLALLACAAAGTVIYGLAGGVARWLSPFRFGGRAALIAPAAWQDRFHGVLDVLERRLLGPNPLSSPAGRAVLVLLLAATLATVAWRAWPFRAQRVAMAGACLILLLVGLVSTVGVVLLTKEFWTPPRVMAQSGIFWAGCLAICFVGMPRARWLAAGVAAIALLAFLGTCNRVLHEQWRLNMRDLAKANRLVARMESLPGFAGVRTVVFDRPQWFYPARIATTDHDLNISAFGPEWSQAMILKEVSGYELASAADEAAHQTALQHCATATPWPGATAVAIQGELAIVCAPR